MKTKRSIAVIDLKAFYSFVECLDRGLDPFTTPLVVCDKERGKNTIVLSVTPYLKKHGVPSRLRIRDLPKKFNYVYAVPRMERYIEKSSEVISILLDFFSEEDIHVVYSDDTRAISDATSYLMKCGHKSIYLLTNSTDSMSNVNRIRAFQDCVSHYGLDKNHCGVMLVRRRFLYTCPTDDYVKRLPPDCTALISATEALGPTLYESLQRLRPDVTLLPWGFSWDKRFNALKIPYIHQNFKLLAKKGVEMLKRQIEGKQVVNTAVPYVFKKSGRKINP